MKNTQRGFIVPLLLLVIAFLLVGGGAYIFTQNKEVSPAVSGNVELPQATSTKQTTTVTTQTTTETKTVTPSEITISLSKSTVKLLENFDVLVTNLPATDKNTVWKIYLSIYKDSWGKYPPATVTSSNPRATLEAPNVAGQYYVWIVGQTSSGTVVHSAYVSLNVVDTKDSISVVYPNGGEVVTSGSPLTIRWTSSGPGAAQPVEIDLQRKTPTDTQYWYVTTIGTGPGSGSYTWTVPTTDPAGTALYGSQFKILVGRNIERGGVNSPVDVSDAPFTIYTPNPGAGGIN